MYISEIVTTVPENVKERASLEQKVYQVFQKLGIPFERVDNDPAASMEECRGIGEVFGSPVRKDVFLSFSRGSILRCSLCIFTPGCRCS